MFDPSIVIMCIFIVVSFIAVMISYLIPKCVSENVTQFYIVSFSVCMIILGICIGVEIGLSLADCS